MSRPVKITTHVLDTAAGIPAAGIRVALSRHTPSGADEQLAVGVTDADGRVSDLYEGDLGPGVLRIRFDTGAYLQHSTGTAPFFPEVTIDFALSTDDQRGHYHVPLLLSPYGYSTYRGS